MILGAAVVVLMILFFVFVSAIIFGAPYVPTLARERRTALELLDLKPGQTMYELGSGDGSMLIEAAKKGVKAVGFELNPLLVMISRWRGRHYKGLVIVNWQNFWKADFSKADGIFIFQLDKLMKPLEAKIIKDRQGPLRVVSHAFKIPGKKPTKEVGSVILYQY